MKLKIIQFKHGGCFCCACKDIYIFVEDQNGFNGGIIRVVDLLWTYLRSKKYILRQMGWEFNEGLIIPPIVTDEDLILYAKRFTKKREITNYQIVEVSVKTELED